MNFARVTFVGLLGLSIVGCSASSPDASNDESVTESELRVGDFVGTYEPNTEEDGYDFTIVKVKRSGSKLTLDLDGTKYPLSKTGSGVYVFTSGEIAGECDSPGCSYISKISGLVYGKRIKSKDVPSLKLTVKHQHPHPEFEDDIEGETSETLRWTKQ